MPSLEYLEEERQKIWAKLVELEGLIKTKTSEHESEARQSSKKASEYRNKCELSKNSAEQYLKTIESLSEEIKIISEEVEKHKDVIASNNAKSEEVVKQIESSRIDLENKLSFIGENIDEIEGLFENREEIESNIKLLNDLSEKSSDYQSKIDATYKSLTARKQEIDRIYYEIMGFTEKDEETGEETVIEGLKKELEKTYDETESALEELQKAYRQFIDETEKKYTAFTEDKNKKLDLQMNRWESVYAHHNNKIKSLLPGALTAGLSAAYSDKKKGEVDELEKLNLQFRNSIYGMIGVSLIPFAISLVFLFNETSIFSGLVGAIEKIPKLALSILPLYIPVFWVAYFSNKKINLSKRLIEEYSHKEALSKTFEGLSSQIDAMDDEEVSSDLRARLLYNLLEVSSENPGKLISDYNKSDHPLMDTLDKSVKLADAVEKLSKFPGFSKISAMMLKKSQEDLSDVNEKAKRGLGNIENEGT